MVMPGTGELEQLVPIEEQIADGEPQIPTRPSSPLIPLEEKEKRIAPTPTAPRPPLGTPAQIAEQQAIQQIFGTPVLKWNQYIGGDKEWRELVRWDVPIGYTGDLHEIALQSNNDAKTRFRIVIANVDQDIPTDRTLSTPTSFKWDRGILPGGTSVFVEVMSTDGTSITVDGSITGSVR